ncbi:MAG: N-acetylneuraminate synthase family protein [Gemmatimonadaceae bacterium]|nr:N-acetylneuraminate synthase family protein [Gemmatimonadaceae bacterium]
MTAKVRIGDRWVGDGEPCYIVAEIGINHNGDVDIARQLIATAQRCGCDAVKFQKRTPELCVPPEQRDLMRETPWGLMTYLEYRHRVEFGRRDYEEIDAYCRKQRITWFASCWDEQSVDFIESFNPPCYKIASACLTDDALLRHHRSTGRPLVLSTGMSTIEQIDHAVEVLGTNDLILLHATSSYPAKAEELNLRAIFTLRERYGVPVGYSGHEVGLVQTVAAATLGACLVERHITLDRAMWGSDQAASVEPPGLQRLVRDIRVVETAMGDGQKRVYESELPLIKRLRRVNGNGAAPAAPAPAAEPATSTVVTPA